MTLQQLKYIAAVAEYKTISKAAENVFVSQPSLTSSIHQLEEEMNIKIFYRTNKGVALTSEGEVFLSYARQVLEQANLLEETFSGKKHSSSAFSVSCQHYSFAINAFVDVIKEFDSDKYNFTLRETQTYEIIEDVSRLKSELGILYKCSKNEEVIEKLIKKNDLIFTELFVAKPHVFISDKNPLCAKKIVRVEDLEAFPYLIFEQGEHNAFYFSEEPFPAIDHKKTIMVRDRATLFNLLIGLNGFTVSSGVISEELNGKNIIARPLKLDEEMQIGIITKKNVILSRYAKSYIDHIKNHIVMNK
ncbi:MAG: LysR family transcriptional regulator [Treponema sp.]|nr:LysR family transcriptional regulator [Treponema sp.]